MKYLLLLPNMMSKIKYVLPFLILGIMILLPVAELIAQCIPPQFPCCPVPGACGPTCPPCSAVPLDGGISALVVAGVAYGAKRLYGNSKK